MLILYAFVNLNYVKSMLAARGVTIQIPHMSDGGRPNGKDD